MVTRIGRQPTTEAISELPDGLPEVPVKLAQWLVAQYPPKCWDPNKETEGNHHLYRGASDLARTLLQFAEAQAREVLSEEELEEIYGAENAQRESKT